MPRSRLLRLSCEAALVSPATYVFGSLCASALLDCLHGGPRNLALTLFCMAGSAGSFCLWLAMLSLGRWVWRPALIAGIAAALCGAAIALPEDDLWLQPGPHAALWLSLLASLGVALLYIRPSNRATAPEA